MFGEQQHFSQQLRVPSASKRVVYGCVGVHGLALMAGTPSLGAGAPGARQGEGAGAAAGGDPGPGRGVLVETEDGGSNGG